MARFAAFFVRIYESRAFRIAEFAAAVLILAGACVFVLRHDPNKEAFLSCTFRAVTGWYCPGCGLTRAAYHLLTGQVVKALRCHAFCPAVFLFLGWLFYAYFSRRLGFNKKPFLITWPDWVIYSLMGVFFAYCIVRNIPAFSFLLP